MFDSDAPHHWPPSARLPKLGKPTEAEVREAMTRVVAYLWSEEMAEFDSVPETDHIYLQLRVLHAHLYGEGNG